MYICKYSLGFIILQSLEKIVLLTGSNRGNRREYIKHALFFLEQRVGRVLNHSVLYETEPWGFVDKTPFLNQALLVETELDPFDFLNEIHGIERQLGRQRQSRQYYAGRTMDIDIIFFGDRVIRDSLLEIPHPRLANRRFALVPVNEICPEWIHPVLKVSVHNLLERCEDRSGIKKWEEPFH
ncbi:MAG TPA: 2-amino-4-hydroxy-6-hydroxymethyldihydropteridine diphosphokinase [Bacteroidetes bacterium]|nr:2-amino-4-hydroxy-6-hydroxymethyldihydropteridine diphosphokinase [Bacteroidota bacterium]